MSAEVEKLVAEKLLVVVATELINYVQGLGGKATLVIMNRE